MGTALTGLEIRDTYEALIKVTDNGPLDGTLQTLTDGLGNDSTLSLSTTAASIAGTLAVTGASTFSGIVTANQNSNTFGNASLSGRAVILQAGSTNQAIMFKNNLNGDGTLSVGGDATSLDYIFNTYSTGDALVIKNNGNVGIGTASPAAKLQTQQTSAGSGVVGMLLQNVGDTPSTAVSLDFAPHENTTSPTTLARINAIRTATNDAPTDIVFSSYNTTLQERMRITGAGVVGIGTSSSLTTSTYAGKLAVFTAGGANIAVGGASNTDNAIVNRIIGVNSNNGNSGNEGAAEFYGVTSIESAITTSDSNANADSGGYIMFKTKPEAGALAERMRITSAGNVGIGTTPAADKILQLNNGGGAFVRMNLTNTSTGTAGTDGLSLSVETNKAIIKNQENDDLVLGANNSETQLVLAAGGNVGIGTASPQSKLDITASPSAYTSALRLGGETDSSEGNSVGISFKTKVALSASIWENARIATVTESVSSSVYGALAFSTMNATALSEKMRITPTGNVGIGLSNPLAKLTVSDGTNALYVSHNANGPYISSANDANTVYKRQSYDALEHVFLISASERARFTANGLTFNGDTAAANALDDYEEGTWTPTYVGGSVAGTYTASSQAYYTKIGRQVTVYWYSTFSAASGGSGYLEIGGLPFNYAANSQGAISAVSSTFLSYTADSVFAQVTTGGSGSTILLAETTSGADVTIVQSTDVSTSTTLRISLTYFV